MSPTGSHLAVSTHDDEIVMKINAADGSLVYAQKTLNHLVDFYNGAYDSVTTGYCWLAFDDRGVLNIDGAGNIISAQTMKIHCGFFFLVSYPDPGVASSISANYISAVKHIYKPMFLEYSTGTNQLILGAALGEDTSHQDITGIIVLNPATLAITYSKQFDTTNLPYSLNLVQTHAWGYYISVCVCELEQKPEDPIYSSNTLGYFVVQTNTNSEHFAYYTLSNIYQNCLGIYLDSSMKMQILIMKQDSAFVPSLYIGTINNAFSSSSMSLSFINTAGKSYWGYTGSFMGLDSYYITGYRKITSKTQGFIYSTNAAQACTTFTVTYSSTQGLTSGISFSALSHDTSKSTMTVYTQTYSVTYIALGIQASNTVCSLPGQLTLTAPTTQTKYCYDGDPCNIDIGKYYTTQLCTDDPQITFTLLDAASGLPLPISLVVQSAANNNPQLYMLPTGADFGTYTVRVVANLQNKYLYDTSLVITLIISTCCCWDYLSYTMPVIPAWTYSIPLGATETYTVINLDECYTVMSYEAFSSDGSALPYFMTFDTSTSTFSAFTSDPSDIAIYTILVNAIHQGTQVGSTTFTIEVTATLIIIQAMALSAPTVASSMITTSAGCPVTVNVGQYCLVGQTGNCANELMTFTLYSNGVAQTPSDYPYFPMDVTVTSNSVTLYINPDSTLSGNIFTVMIEVYLSNHPQVIDSSYTFDLLVDSYTLTAPTIAQSTYNLQAQSTYTINIGQYSYTPSVCNSAAIKFSIYINSKLLSTYSKSTLDMTATTTGDYVSLLYLPAEKEKNKAYTVQVKAQLLYSGEAYTPIDSSYSFIIKIYSMCDTLQFVPPFPTVADKLYVVGTQPLVIPFDIIPVNVSYCQTASVDYYFLINGQWPTAIQRSVIQLDNTARTLSVYTQTAGFANLYVITVVGEIFVYTPKQKSAFFNFNLYISLTQDVSIPATNNFKLDDQIVYAGRPITYSIESIVTGFDTAFTLTCDLKTAKPFTTFQNNVFYFTPTLSQVGNYTITCKVENFIISQSLDFKTIVTLSPSDQAALIANQTTTNAADVKPEIVYTPPTSSSSSSKKIENEKIVKGPLSGKITKLTGLGEMTIQFQKNVATSDNYTQWNNTKLQITRTSQGVSTNEIVKYNITNLVNKVLTLQLYFENPNSISTSGVSIFNSFIRNGTMYLLNFWMKTSCLVQMGTFYISSRAITP